MSKQERPKLSDRVQRGDFVFSRPARDQTFTDVFPTVASLKVHVVEHTSDGRERPYYYTDTSFSAAVDCSNPKCYGGGAWLQYDVHDMVRERRTDGVFHHACKGYEGSPKGHRRHGPCHHHFDVTVHIEYKPEP